MSEKNSEITMYICSAKITYWFYFYWDLGDITGSIPIQL